MNKPFSLQVYLLIHNTILCRLRFGFVVNYNYIIIIYDYMTIVCVELIPFWSMMSQWGIMGTQDGAPWLPTTQLVMLLRSYVNAFHNVTLGDAKILTVEPRWFERGVKEAIHIQISKPPGVGVERSTFWTLWIYIPQDTAAIPSWHSKNTYGWSEEACSAVKSISVW